MLMPDVNVLVNAHRADSPHHQVAADWLTATVRAAEPFALSELVLQGFLRVATNRKIWTRPSSWVEASGFVSALRSQPGCRLIRPGARHFDLFIALCADAKVAGGLIADAYHAALAIENGCQWVTGDADFARFTGLRWTLLK